MVTVEATNKQLWRLSYAEGAVTGQVGTTALSLAKPSVLYPIVHPTDPLHRVTLTQARLDPGTHTSMTIQWGGFSVGAGADSGGNRGPWSTAADTIAPDPWFRIDRPILLNLNLFKRRADGLGTVLGWEPSANPADIFFEREHLFGGSFFAQEVDDTSVFSGAAQLLTMESAAVNRATSTADNSADNLVTGQPMRLVEAASGALEVQGFGGAGGDCMAIGHVFMEEDPILSHGVTNANDEGEFSAGGTIARTTTEPVYRVLRLLESGDFISLNTCHLGVTSAAAPGDTTARILSVPMKTETIGISATAFTVADPVVITLDSPHGWTAVETFVVEIRANTSGLTTPADLTRELNTYHIATATSATEFSIEVDNTGNDLVADGVAWVQEKTEASQVFLTCTNGKSVTTQCEQVFGNGRTQSLVMLELTSGGAGGSATGYIEGSTHFREYGDRFYFDTEATEAIGDDDFTAVVDLSAETRSLVIERASISTNAEVKCQLGTATDAAGTAFVPFCEATTDDLPDITGPFLLSPNIQFVVLRVDGTGGAVASAAHAAISGYYAEERV